MISYPSKQHTFNIWIVLRIEKLEEVASSKLSSLKRTSFAPGFHDTKYNKYSSQFSDSFLLAISKEKLTKSNLKYVIPKHFPVY